MTADTLHQPTNDLNNSPGDEKRTVTFEAAVSLADQPLEGEPGARAGPAEAGPTPDPVAVAEPAKRPWRKRFFDGLFGLEAWEAVEVEALPVVEVVPLPSMVSPDEVFSAAPALSPSAPSASLRTSSLGINSVAGPALSVVEGPLFTLDEVRALVQVELGHTREGIVQAELSRAPSEVKVGLLGTELHVLNEEERHTLQNSDMPLRERVELLDFIRERRTRVEQQIAEMEASVAQRIAETDLVLAELEGRSVVASLREELERQKEQMRELRIANSEWAKGKGRGLGLWPVLLALLLLAVGVAGILLPRQTDPAPTFLVEMATLYQASGETEEAIRVLDEAVEAGIRDAETLGRVGQTYYALEEYQKAIGVLAQAVEKAPQNEDIYLALARSYSEAGQHEQAIAQYERLIEISPGSWRYYFEMGQQYEALQAYDQALAQYRKSAEVAPERVEGYVFQGNLWRNLERYDEAIEQYQRALEINPNMWWVRSVLGQSYAGLQDWDRAVEQFRAAVELAPDNPSPYLEMGKVWRAQGEHEEALSWYQDALDVQPDHVPTLLEMGDTYVEIEDCEQAVLQFLRVLEIQPNNKVAQDGLKACQGE